MLHWQPYSTTSLKQQRTTFTFKALFDTEDYGGDNSAVQVPWLITFCSQLPLYDTENYGDDSSEVQVP